MIAVPILQPGDKVHIVIPDNGDGGARVHKELSAIYANQGVEVICTTAISSNIPQCGVVAVFRKPSPGAGFRKRPDGLWEEK